MGAPNRSYMGCGSACVCGYPDASAHLGHMIDWKGGIGHDGGCELGMKNNHPCSCGGARAWKYLEKVLRKDLGLEVKLPLDKTVNI